MCIKYGFIFFLSLFITQCTAHELNSLENKSNGTISNCTNANHCSSEEMINEILILIGRLQSVTHIDKIQKKVTGLIDDTNNRTNIQLESSSDVIDNLSAAAFATLVLNKKQIGTCFEGKLKQITALTAQIIGDRNDCINFHHSTGLDWLQNANRTISEFETLVSSITIKFSKCLFEHSNVSSCLWDLFQTIQDWSINLPKIIANIRNNADRIAAEVREKVTNCFSISTASSVTQIIGLVVNVSQCAHLNANPDCKKTSMDTQKSCLNFVENIHFDKNAVTYAILALFNTKHFMSEQLSNLERIKNYKTINSLFLVNDLFNETKSLINILIKESDWTGNTLKCMNDLMTKTLNFNNDIINILTQCQESRMQSTINFIFNDIQTIDVIIKLICELPIKAAKCILDHSCLTKIFEEIRKIPDIISSISTMMSTISTQVLISVDNIENCTGVALNTTMQFTSTFITEIKNCVSNETAPVVERGQST